MKAQHLSMAAVIIFAGMAVSAADASARGWSRSYTGPYGHGFSQNFSVNRGAFPGTVNRSRSLQLNNGQGYNHTKTGSCSGGTCNATGTTTLNNGYSSSHTGTATYGNGTATLNRSGSNSNGGTGSSTTSCTSGAGCSGTFTTTPPQ
jgi:hypothetical protein